MIMQHCDVILVGDSGVGKTSLINQLVYSTFCNEHDLTVGVDFSTKVVIDPSGSTPFKLRLWDTAGHVTFHTIIQSYYQKANIFVFVYDITSHRSYTHIAQWVEDCKKFTKCDGVYILIGNKRDLCTQRQVSYQEARAFADMQKFDLFFEVCSAQSAEVNRTFGTIVSRYFRHKETDRSHTLLDMWGRYDRSCERQCCVIL